MGRPASLRTSRWRRRMPTHAACGSWTGPTKFTEIRSGGWSCASTRRASQPPTDSAEDVIRAMRSLEQSYLVGVKGVTEVWLVRHADVYDGLDDVHDPPLSPRGREQASSLAVRLRSLPVAAVFSSPARRAQETARHLTDDVHLDARIGEASASFTGGRLAVEERAIEIVARVRAAGDHALPAHPAAAAVM